ncbi:MULTISPECIES: acyl carrier protein [Myxococcaceae]|uniref:acyl carrier protein n=1 Tax=Myxococcaceae TaxID=31 RepID=UPI00129D1F29|nr:MULTISPECIES: acyl carrier protein [Myxococcaceae]MBF5043129.1 acyl carrier protein [Simulacricoccus sp. 17bor-14]
MSIESDLQRYISSELVLERGRNQLVQAQEPLLSSGRVDSLGLLQLLDYVEQQYGVSLLAFGEPQSFDTVEGIAQAIRAMRGVPGEA